MVPDVEYYAFFDRLAMVYRSGWRSSAQAELTESYVHFTTVEFVTKMEIQVILSKKRMAAYDSVKTVTTSSKSAIMSKSKMGHTFADVVTEFIKDLSRDVDFIEALD